MKTIITTAIFALLIAVATSAAAATFYKWVDSQGTTHYGETPPKGVSSKVVHTYNSASSDQADEIQKLDQRRAEDSRENLEARKKAARQKQAEEHPQQATADRCDRLRKNLNILENRPIVRTKNPKTGKMEVLDKHKRQEMIDQTRKGLQFCHGQNGGQQDQGNQ